MKIRLDLRLLFAALMVAGLYDAPAQTPQPAVLPDLNYKRLLNDLKVIVATTPSTGDDLTIGLVLRYGSAYDPAEKGGLAHLVSRMFMKGTADRSAQEIQDELKYLTATLDLRCDWDGMYFMLRTQTQNFERALLLLYQVVGEAQFTDEDFAKTKAEIIQELEKREDPRNRLRTQLEATLFRGTTYGRQLRGSRASLQNITLGDVRLFYRRFFSSGSASLVAAGSAPVSQVMQKATRIWGVWVKKDEVPFTFLSPREPAARNIYLRDDPATPAAQFILGGIWPRRDDPSYYPSILAARILQDRVTKTLPTSLLTVGAEGRRLPGLFYIQGQAAAEQAVEEIRRILDLVEALKESNVTTDELTEAQNRWINEFNQGQTTTESVCQMIMDSELYRLGTNYAASFTDIVRRTGPDSVKEAAKEWLLPGGVVIMVHGPAGVLRPELEKLGQVQSIAP